MVGRRGHQVEVRSRPRNSATQLVASFEGEKRKKKKRITENNSVKKKFEIKNLIGNR
jgi:hypothetical protein